MFVIAGIVLVFACVIGGYVAMGSKLGVLWQPFEVVIIVGAAIDALIVGNPKSVLTKTARVSDEELEEELTKREEEIFAKVKAEIKQAIEESPDLKELHQHLVIDQTPEGLRIQIVDRAGKPMFTSGSSRMQKQTRLLLTKITQVVRDLPNKISISGHTHSTPFRGSRKGYENWELSSNRALASRRVIVEGRLNLKQISHVSGKEATQPLIKDNPKDARNRRMRLAIRFSNVTGAVRGSNRPSRHLPRRLPQCAENFSRTQQIPIFMLSMNYLAPW